MSFSQSLFSRRCGLGSNLARVTCECQPSARLCLKFGKQIVSYHGVAARIRMDIRLRIDLDGTQAHGIKRVSKVKNGYPDWQCGLPERIEIGVDEIGRKGGWDQEEMCIRDS